MPTKGVNCPSNDGHDVFLHVLLKVRFWFSFYQERNLCHLSLKMKRLVTTAEMMLCDTWSSVIKGDTTYTCLVLSGPAHAETTWIKRFWPARAAPASLLLGLRPSRDHNLERNPSQPESPSWPLLKSWSPETVRDDKIIGFALRQ